MLKIERLIWYKIDRILYFYFFKKDTCLRLNLNFGLLLENVFNDISVALFFNRIISNNVRLQQIAKVGMIETYRWR